MKFNSVHLINYRYHGDLKIEFRAGFNVIVGVNGSGKTTILKSLCDALFAGRTYKCRMSGQRVGSLMEEGIAKIRTDVVDGRYRFEPQYPIEVRAQADAFESTWDWKVFKESQEGYSQLEGEPPSLPIEDQGLQTQNRQKIWPVFAFYRANRFWNGARPSEMQAATQRDSRVDGYDSWWDASLDTSALQSWVISKCLERLQTSSQMSVAFESIQDDDLGRVNAVLAQAVEDAKGLKYDMKQKSLLVEWCDKLREPTAFENLSDGQRAVIGLISDIARRICLLNPDLGSLAAQKTPGVVLIDEPELHLHPKWQRLLTGALKRAFPAVQFIVASHSPQILGELKPEEIIVLDRNGTSHPQVSYGLDSSAVLEEIMGATARTAEVDTAVSSLFKALELGQLNEARDLLRQLKANAPGIPELAGAEALLKRKEVLGR